MIFKYIQTRDYDYNLLYLPLITFYLRFGNEVDRFNGLIDSGSDLTIFPIRLAALFNFKLSLKNRIKMRSASSHVFYVYPSPYRVNFTLTCTGFRNITWNSLVYFSESQPTILLGQKGFFDNVDVNFSWRRKEIEIIV